MAVLADIYKRLFALKDHTHSDLIPVTGSNTNGYYRKWGNGDLEMYGSIEISDVIALENCRETPCTVTFPMAFKSTTYFFNFVVYGQTPEAGTRAYHFSSNKTESTIDIADHDMALFGSHKKTVTVDWYAIGKWK